MSEKPVYKPTAGKCSRCGNDKTWGVKIKNAKTGKEMPAHIDADGHLIGKGDCPEFAAPAAFAQKPAVTPTPVEKTPAQEPAAPAKVVMIDKKKDLARQVVETLHQLSSVIDRLAELAGKWSEMTS